MNKKLIAIGFALIIVFVGLSGCFGPSDRDKFVGIWSGTISHSIVENVSVSITFLSDGTYTAKIGGLVAENGNWDVKDQKLTKQGDSNPMVTYTYAFSDDNNKVVISNTLEYEVWTLTKSP